MKRSIREHLMRETSRVPENARWQNAFRLKKLGKQGKIFTERKTHFADSKFSSFKFFPNCDF